MKLQLLPEWVTGYKKAYLRNDVFAGLTVGILLIPQGMAYAIIAGLPPVYGLYASIVPILVYAVLGTSRHLAVGPVAMDSLLVAQFVGTMAKIGTEHYISLAIMLALLTGAIQIMMGALKMGFLVNFLSKPVISGFTSAAALIIGFSQIKDLFGIKMERSSKIQDLVIEFANAVSQTHWITLILGLSCVALILIIRKWKRKLPASLAVVVVSILVVWLVGLDKEGVPIVGVIPEGLPSFVLPEFNWQLIQELLPMAATLAIVAFMEATSVSKAVLASEKEKYVVHPNRELIALGAANLIGSLFQSYPVTGGFSRTAVNKRAGARTQLASVISLLLILFTLLFLTPLFYYLPKTALAAIIMVAVIGLIDLAYPIRLWKFRKIELAMLMVTFIVTLTVGIPIGIGVGVSLSILVMVYLSTKPHVAELGKIEGTNQYRNLNRFDSLEVRPDVMVFRFDAPLYFANAQYLKERLTEYAVKKGSDLKLIVLNMESIGRIDSTAITILEELVKEFHEQEINIHFTGTIGPVRDVLFKSGFMERFGQDIFFLDIHFAIDQYDEPLSENRKKTNKLASQATEKEEK